MNQNQLSENQLRELMQAAHAAYAHAYVPYSRFPVGSAVLVRHPEQNKTLIIQGCNVENASFGLAICAERVAITKAISEGYRELLAVAVAAQHARPCFPCGSCLQFIREFGAEIDMIFEDAQGQLVRHAIAELLPFAFTADDLAVTYTQSRQQEGEK